MQILLLHDAQEAVQGRDVVVLEDHLDPSNRARYVSGRADLSILTVACEQAPCHWMDAARWSRSIGKEE